MIDEEIEETDHLDRCYHISGYQLFSDGQKMIYFLGCN